MRAMCPQFKIGLRRIADMQGDPAYKFLVMEPGAEWMTGTHALIVLPGANGTREFKFMHPNECTDLPFECPLAEVERDDYTDEIPDAGVYLVRWFCQMDGVLWPSGAEFEGESGVIHIDHIEGCAE